jgi:hypothetical protein
MVSPFSTARPLDRRGTVSRGASRRGWRRALGALVGAGAGVVAAACSEGNAAPQPDDTCAMLSAECGSCTDPGAQSICETAAASQDPVQCQVALGDTKVRAFCSGGGDAGAGDSSGDAPDAGEAGPLPACGAQSTDAGTCACAQDCSPGCAVGGCGVECLASATCTPTCVGGKCHFVCESGSTCEGSCVGGGCTFDCKPGSNCANSCAGGGCVFTCEDGSVCNDTCTGTGCIGP